jgi:hypothetical protein
LINTYKNGLATSPEQFNTQNEFAISTKLPTRVAIKSVIATVASGGGGNPDVNSTAGLNC